MRYTILKGCHYSWPLFNPIVRILKKDFRRTLELKVKFNKSNKYTIDKQRDCNKLYGYSEGHHHTSSMRIGWSYDPDNEDFMNVNYYAFSEGINIKNGLYKIVSKVSLDRWYTIKVTTIRIDDDNIEDSVYIEDDHGILVGYYTNVRKLKSKRYFTYNILPYFGGTTTAPHTMHIDMEILKNEIA